MFSTKLIVLLAGVVGLRLGVRSQRSRIEPWMDQFHWEPDDVTDSRLRGRIS